MATPTLGELPQNLETDLRRLRDEVDALQIATADKRTPWYRKASNIFSLVALLVSIGTSTWQYFIQHKKDVEQERANKLAMLQQLAVDIIDVHKQIKDTWNTGGYSEGRDIAALLNVKRGVMISRAKTLVNELNFQVPPEILYEIGEQEEIDNDMEEAEKFYLRALGAVPAAKFDLLKVSCLRSLGTIYMTPNTSKFNLNVGRQRFNEIFSTEYLGGKNDYNSIFQRAVAYETWGKLEYSNNNLKEGREAYDNAIREYSALTLANKQSTRGLAEITREKARALSPQN